MIVLLFNAQKENKEKYWNQGFPLYFANKSEQIKVVFYPVNSY